MTAAKLSLRGYADHRRERGLPGRTHTAVRKAIQEGRLRASVEREGRRWYIDAELADAEWDHRTDSTQQRTPREKRSPLFDGEGPEALEAGRGGEQGPKGGPGVNELQRRRLECQVQLAQLDLEERSGSLVSAAGVRARAFETARAAKNRILAVVDRVDATLAPRMSRAKVRRILTEELLAALEVLSTGEPEKE